MHIQLDDKEIGSDGVDFFHLNEDMLQLMTLINMVQTLSFTNVTKLLTWKYGPDAGIYKYGAVTDF
jgi:hypothetical protein